MVYLRNSWWDNHNSSWDSSIRFPTLFLDEPFYRSNQSLTIKFKLKDKVSLRIDSENRVNTTGIDFTNSFILGWSKTETEFKIDLELSIWPSSPHYSPPPKEEFTCYKKGKLTFYGMKNTKGFVDLASIKPSIDPDGTKDWDCISDFIKENNLYTFSTDFTDIEIECSGIELEIMG